MTLITVPTLLKSSMDKASLTLQRTDFVMRSAFTRKRQVLAWPSGHMWVASCSVPALEEPDSGLMRSFLTKLVGRVNTFQFPVPGYTGPSNGYAGAVGLVKGAGQSGYSLLTDGWAISTTVLPEGSYFNVNGELKMTTAPVVSNGAGEATITFGPALRASPADNAPITITNPYAVMVMSNADGASWDVSAPRFNSFALQFEEAVD